MLTDLLGLLKDDPPALSYAKTAYKVKGKNTK